VYIALREFTYSETISMNTIFRHVLITRFNVIGWGTVDKYRNTTRDEEWLKHRFELFKQYCLPSVQNQSCSDFKWYVFFDSKTPAKYREMIAHINDDMKMFIPVFVPPITHQKLDLYYSELLTHMPEIIRPDCDFLISTRLDNDDIIHTDFIRTVQENFQRTHKHVINMRYGYKLDLRNNKLYQSKQYSNPFTSFIEKKPFKLPFLTQKCFKTVLHTTHGSLKNKYRVNQITDKRYWVQALHERNLVNDVKPQRKAIKIDKLATNGGFAFLEILLGDSLKLS